MNLKLAKKTSSVLLTITAVLVGGIGIMNNIKKENHELVNALEFRLSPSSPIVEHETHKSTNGLHDVNVVETTDVFVRNAQSEYSIVTLDDAEAIKAATMISNHVRLATGYKLNVVSLNNTISYQPSNKIIFIGTDRIAQEAGVVKTNKDLGGTGYQITSKDNSVFILTNSVNGFQQAARKFLEVVIGFDRISSNTVVYKKSGEYLPKMDIVEKPDFEMHLQGNKVDSTTLYEMGFSTVRKVFYNGIVKTQHNSFDFVPVTNASRHPSWFNSSITQLCYTARGNQQEYQALLNHVFGVIKDILAADSVVPNVTFTIEDNHDACNCSACQSNFNKYGTHSASVIKFCNDLDVLVQNYLQEQAILNNTTKRDFNIVFFAYNKYEKAPVKLENGKYVPIDESVVCHDHIAPYIAPIGASYTSSFYDDINISYKESVEGWKSCANKTFMWLYETNYSHYLYPYNSYSSMQETYRFCKTNGAYLMLNEGQFNQGNVTCFGKFKEYFNSKTEFDVNYPYNQIVNDFFVNYFKDACIPMKTYFYELQTYIQELYSKYSSDLHGSIYENIAQDRFWPKKLLDHWMDLINEANDLIKKYEFSDPQMFENLKQNILIESIFPRFALLTHHVGKFDSDSLYLERKSFVEDCSLLGISFISELVDLANTFSSWGF